MSRREEKRRESEREKERKRTIKEKREQATRPSDYAMQPL